MSARAHIGEPLRIMVVEDDCLIASDISAMVEEVGEDRVVCRAVNTREAMECAHDWSPAGAFVDVNLEDGRTGPHIGAELSRRGVAVVYATGNPEQIPSTNSGLAAAIKPISAQCVADALEMIHAHQEGRPRPVLRDGCRLVMPPFPGG
jgi:chemotaxis response regulator CheB